METMGKSVSTIGLLSVVIQKRQYRSRRDAPWEERRKKEGQDGRDDDLWMSILGSEKK